MKLFRPNFHIKADVNGYNGKSLYCEMIRIRSLSPEVKVMEKARDINFKRKLEDSPFNFETTFNKEKKEQEIEKNEQDCYSDRGKKEREIFNNRKEKKERDPYSNREQTFNNSKENLKKKENISKEMLDLKSMSSFKSNDFLRDDSKGNFCGSKENTPKKNLIHKNLLDKLFDHSPEKVQNQNNLKNNNEQNPYKKNKSEEKIRSKYNVMRKKVRDEKIEEKKLKNYLEETTFHNIVYK